MVGRPTSCTPEVVDILEDKVRQGIPVIRAVECAGISHTSFYEWMQRAESGEQPYADFADRMRRAKSDLLAKLASTVHEVALYGEKEETRVRAAQWILERADRQHWSKSTDVNMHVEQQRTEVKMIPPETPTEALEAELEEMSG